MTDKDIQYNHHMVAFIDVLGQKELFKELEGQDLRDNHPKLIEVHKKTAMFVDALRTGFQGFFNSYTADKESTVQVHPSKKDQFDAMMKSNLKHQQFSDCIQAYVSLHSEKYYSNAINGVFGVLAACGGLLLLSLSLRRSFRAGIEVGLGTELGNGEIYGPVLYKAYELESKVAQYPRIVIGQELINFLMNLANKVSQIPNQTPEDLEICKGSAERCLKMIIRDLDGVPILDYLGKDFISNVYNNLDEVKKNKYREMCQQAFDYVESEYTSRKQGGDAKLALRYYLLLNYFKAKSPFPKK